MIAVDVVRPVPVRVMVWPGLADGNAAFAGVPLVAVALASVSVAVKLSATLTPPCVVTVIGPYDPLFSGTVRLTAVPEENTSGPWLTLLASRTLVEPD